LEFTSATKLRPLFSVLCAMARNIFTIYGLFPSDILGMKLSTILTMTVQLHLMLWFLKLTSTSISFKQHLIATSRYIHSRDETILTEQKVRREEHHGQLYK